MKRWLAYSLVLFLLFTCKETRNSKPQINYNSDSLVIRSVPGAGKTSVTTEKAPEQTLLIDSSNLSKTRRIELFFDKLHRQKKFNGTALVAQRGAIIYMGAFGYKDLRKKDRLNIETPFQLASVSKQFTAMAIMMLNEQGKLSYEDTVQKFFPYFPYKGITIRHLLVHRSGLPDYTYFCEDYHDRTKPVSNKEVIEIMTRHRPKPYLLPGRRHDYSNTGYCVLAAIVEKISGQEFSDYMQLHVFEPLGMNHTFIYSKIRGNMHPEAASGHKANGVSLADDYLNGVTGDKGVYTTVTDLFKWDQALYTEKLIKQSTLAEAFKPGNKEMHRPFNYGFGWRIFTYPNGEKILFHAGWWKGFKTFYLHNPKDQSAVIILSNRVNHSFNNIDELMDILYDRKKLPHRKYYRKILHSP